MADAPGAAAAAAGAAAAAAAATPAAATPAAAAAASSAASRGPVRRVVFHVTGFGKFADVARNPTSVMVPRLEEYARLNLNLHRPPLDAMVVSDATVLEVTTVAVDAHLAALEAALAARAGAAEAAGETHVLLHFGVAAGRGLFSVEAAAYNEADFCVPDEAGLVLTGAPVDGAEAFGAPRVATLPVHWLAARLSERYLETEVSDDPGRYICNWTYYRSAQTAARLDAAAAGGGAAAAVAAATPASPSAADRRSRRYHSLFVHVPLFAVASLDEQLAMAASLMADITLALVAPPAGAWDVSPVTAVAAAVAAGSAATAAAATAAAAAAGAPTAGGAGSDGARHVADEALDVVGVALPSLPASAADSEVGMTVVSLLLSLGASAGAARRAVEMVANAGMLTDVDSAVEAAAILALDMDAGGDDGGSEDEGEAGAEEGRARAAPTTLPPARTSSSPSAAAGVATATAGARRGGGTAGAGTGGGVRGSPGGSARGSPSASGSGSGSGSGSRHGGGRTSRSPRASGGDSSEYKMVIVVRGDLGMSTGKVAAQACHAALAAVRRLNGSRSGVVRTWESQGEPVILLKADGGMEQLRALEGEARARGLPTAAIRDAGRTEVAPGTTTVLAVGPAPKGDIDAVTGDLKLL